MAQRATPRISRIGKAFFLVVVAVIALIAAASKPLGTLAAATGSRPVVRTIAGLVQGRNTGPQDEYLGIPYAAPPVGALRWRAPQPAEPWPGIRQAAASLAASIRLTAGIVALATISWAGFNPVRGLAPNVLAASYPAAWIYFAGPAARGALAGIAARSRPPLTGKLRHDPAIPCYQRCALPHDEHGRAADARRNSPIEDPGAASRPSDLRRAL